MPSLLYEQDLNKFIMSDFSQAELAEIKSYIISAMKELRSCYNCQPAGREDGDIWLGGEESDVYDLILFELEAPEKYLEKIAEFLICPNCGTRLDESSPIGVASATDKLANQLWERWVAKYGKDYQDFQEFLNKYPFLGADHRLGKALLKSISRFPKKSISRRVGFRARAINSAVKTSADMLPPPLAIPAAEGRFNHYAQRVFYLANSEQGAANEVLEAEGEVWLQKFRLHQAENILDLTVSAFGDYFNEENLLTFGLLYGEFLSRLVERKTGWKPEYFIHRYIADCARRNGFDGIKFPSSRWLKDNLVLFKWEDAEVEPIGAPFKFHLPQIYLKLVNTSGRFEFSFPEPTFLIERLIEEFNNEHQIIDETIFPHLPYPKS